MLRILFTGHQIGSLFTNKDKIPTDCITHQNFNVLRVRLVIQVRQLVISTNVKWNISLWIKGSQFTNIYQITNENIILIVSLSTKEQI